MIIRMYPIGGLVGVSPSLPAPFRLLSRLVAGIMYQSDAIVGADTVDRPYMDVMRKIADNLLSYISQLWENVKFPVLIHYGKHLKQDKKSTLIYYCNFAKH